MIKTTLCTIIFLSVFSFPFSSFAQRQPLSELDKTIRQAARQRQKYVEAFVNLTAVETKTTEIFDKNGRLEKQRKVVSDFLVYQSPFKKDAVNEYRIAREVDGKAVGKQSKQTTKLFEQLAKALTLEQEFNRLREENLKHTLRFYRWGITLQPLQQFDPNYSLGFEFEIIGREKVDERETILLSYKQKVFYLASSTGLLKNFVNPQTGNRGRVWLDAKDSQVVRWVNEATVIDLDIKEEVVYVRDEIEYQPSAFGIPIPKKIITSFFDKYEKKTDVKTLRLAGRITYTYDEFKRFDIETDYEIQKPKQEKP